MGVPNDHPEPLPSFSESFCVGVTQINGDMPHPIFARLTYDSDTHGENINSSAKAMNFGNGEC